MDTEKFFQITSSDLTCNTSYPINRKFFSIYQSDTDIMQDVRELSLYYHIPFCRHLCRFCEYTRFLADNEADQPGFLNELNFYEQFFNKSHKRQ